MDASVAQKSSLTIEHVEAVEWTNYPLTIAVAPGTSILIRFSYMENRFDAAAIQRLATHFQTMLEGILAEPLQRIADLPILTTAEYQQLLLDWNATNTVYLQDTCLPDLFAAQVEDTPDAVALDYEGEQLSYDELNRRANSLAHYLRRLGVSPEIPVGLCLERSLEMVIGLLAILKAGGAYLPLDPAHPHERLNLMLRETQTSVLLTHQRLLHQLPAFAEHVLCLDRDWSLLDNEQSDNPRSEVTLSNLAYIIYTSGSTGAPKGTLLTHRGLNNLVSAQVQAFAITPTSRVLQFASVGFDAAVSELFTTLLTGATLVLVSKETLLPGPQLLHCLQEQAITIVTLPPSALAVLPQATLPALRTLVAAGEACSTAIVARWSPNRRFLNAYGPTEASVCATIAICEDTRDMPPIGRPIANVQVYVLDALLRPVPIGVTGELYLASIGLARGYLARPDITAERFIPHPFSSEPGTRLYRTGDLVRYLPDGQLEYLGRSDEQVKIRGYRIELGEIEVVLRQHPLLLEAIVEAKERQSGDQQLIAYVIPLSAQMPSPSELRSFLSASLPSYMLPAAFIPLATLPLTPNGKVDRHALPTLDGSRPDLDKPYLAPRTNTEHTLSTIWSQSLGVQNVGIHDNFFRARWRLYSLHSNRSQSHRRWSCAHSTPSFPASDHRPTRRRRWHQPHNT